MENPEARNQVEERLSAGALHVTGGRIRLHQKGRHQPKLPPVARRVEQGPALRSRLCAVAPEPRGNPPSISA